MHYFLYVRKITNTFHSHNRPNKIDLLNGRKEFTYELKYMLKYMLFIFTSHLGE